jgi:outer membrane receptor protein involved in Fe transport
LVAGRCAGQAVTAGNSAVPSEPDEIVRLSLFQVVSDEHGYQASNTLSGTRLNSRLDDLGSSITVITKRQFEDFALLDINDVFRYEASTEGTDNYTSFNRNRSGGVNDQVQSDPQLANRIRGLAQSGQSPGGANAAWGNFSSNNNLPFDPYNLDAVEISRGPNSNLFGLGAAAGTVTAVLSQANLSRTAFAADTRIDSYGGHREGANFNTPVWPGKLGLRLATVNESKGFVRQPSSERIQRAYGALLAQPFARTTVRVLAERYRNFNRRPNSLTPRDTTAEWKAAGSPTWDPTTQMVTLASGQRLGPFVADTTSTALPGLVGVTTNLPALPAGLIGGYNTFYAHPAVYLDGDSISYFSVMRSNNLSSSGNPSNPFTTANGPLRYLQSATLVMRQRDLLGASSLPLYLVSGTTDRSLYDWTKTNIAAPNYSREQATTASAEIEQIVLDTPQHLLAARVGAFQQKFSRFNANLLDNLETVIYVDVNEKRLDGSPNPFFKRPYIEATVPSKTGRTVDNSILTADLAYQITPAAFPRWLQWVGRQRFGAHAEQNFTDTINNTYVERVADDHTWIDPTNRIGSQAPAQRFYLGDATGQNVDYAPAAIDGVAGTYPLTWFNNRTGTWTNEPVQMAALASSGSGARQRNEVRTFNFTAQSFFFHDRLVLTAGWRRDRQRQRTGAGAFVNPATGLADFSNTGIFGPVTNYRPPAANSPLLNLTGWADQGGDTKTYGGVYKLLPWLRVHFNRSDSFQPQVVRQALDTLGPLPNPHGDATEWGVAFTALEGRLQVRLNHYQTRELQSRGSEVGTLGNRYLDMEGRPDANNNIQLGSFRYFCQQIALGRFAAAGNPQPAQAELDQAVAKLMGVSPEWYNRLVYSGPSQPQTVGTTDVSSRGFELEATYNPTRHLRMKFTGSQTRARDDRVSPDIYNWWLTRVPVWESTHSDIVPGDGLGPTWWTRVPAGQRNETPQARYLAEQWGPFAAATANAGRPRTQIREWHFAGMAGYDFTEGPLKNFSVGGAVRWESRASIGFLAGPAETSGPFQGAVLFLDNNKPVWDSPHTYLDLSAGYRFRLFGDKVRAKLQLNIVNATESGRLQTIGVNPDGQGYAFRIIDPRKFVLSTSFEL